jgi:hypothetical protein
MKRPVIFVSIVILFLVGNALSQCRDIRIPKGQISTVVKGVTQSKYPCYRIRAKFGQKITLHLSSPSQKTRFSLSEDHYDSGFVAEDIRDWEGKLGDVNAYLVTVGGSRPGTLFKLELTLR